MPQPIRIQRTRCHRHCFARSAWCIAFAFAAVSACDGDDTPVCEDPQSCADTSEVTDAGEGVDVGDATSAADAATDLWTFEPADAGDVGAADTADASADAPCGPNGTLHGDHCHCDAGYIEVDDVCVLPPTCESVDPWEPDDSAAEAIVWDSEWEVVERQMCADDVDYFSLPLTAGHRLVAEATTDDPAHVVTLSIWKPGVNPRYESSHAVATGSDGETVLNIGIEASGDWLLRVTSGTPEVQGAYVFGFEEVTAP